MPAKTQQEKGQFEMLQVDQQIESAMSEQNEKLDNLNYQVGDLLSKEDDLNKSTQEQTDVLKGMSQKIGSTKVETSSGGDFTGQAALDSLVAETREEKGLLSDIKSLLGGKGKRAADVSDSSSNGLISDLTKGSNKGGLMDIAMLMAVLGGTFLILGKGLNMLGDIDYKKYLIITTSISLLFTTLSSILKADITIKDVLAFAIFSDVYGSAVVDTLNKFARIEDIPRSKLNLGYEMTAMLIATFGLLNTVGVLNLKQALQYNISSAIVAEGLVESSKILNNLTVLGKEKLYSLGALAATIVPAYMLLVKLENEISFMTSTSMAIYGFTLPTLAKSLVATATVIDKMPNSFNVKSVLMVSMLAAGLYPFVTNALKVFRAITPQMQQSGLDIALRKLDYTKGAGVSFTGANSVGGYNESTMAIAMRLGMGFAALPLLGVTMLAVAGLFHLYDKMGGKFITPPMNWSLGVGVAMYLFSQSFSQIMDSVEGESIMSTTKNVAGKHGMSTFDSKNITKSNLPGSLAIIGAIAVSMVVVAGILQFFPKRAENTTPSFNWSISSGIGIWLFAKATVKIINAMKGAPGSFSFSAKGRAKTGKGLLQGSMGGDFPQMTAMLYVISMAISMVSVAHILNWFPKNPKAPPLLWVIGVGLAMNMFVSAYKQITMTVNQKEGFMGMGGTSKKFNGKGMIGGIFYMNMMAISMISVANILNFFPSNPKTPPIGWAISVGLSMILFSKSVAMVQKISNKINISGDASHTVNIKNANKSKGAFRTLMGISLAIVATAYVFQLLPKNDNQYKAPKLKWIALTGLALVAFSVPMLILSKAKLNKAMAKDNLSEIADNKKSKRGGGGAVMQMIKIALAVVAVATIFKMLPETNSLKAPPATWTLRTITAILAFAGGLLAFQKFLGKSIGGGKENILYKQMFKVSLSLVGIAWLFQLLPNNYKAPDFMWSFKVGMAIVGYTAIIVALVKLRIKPQEMSRGIQLINKVALSIVGMAWIFQAMPSDARAPSPTFSLFAGMALLTVAGSMALMGRWSKNIKKGYKVFDNVLMGALGVVAIMAIAGKTGATMDDLLTFSAFIGVTVGIALLLGLLGKRSKVIVRGAKVLTALSKPLMYLAFSMLLITAALSINPIATVAGIGILILSVGAIAYIGNIVGSKRVSKRLRRAAFALELMMLPITTLTANLLVWTIMLSAKPEETVAGVGILILTVSAIAFIGYLVGNKSIAKNIALGAVVLTLMNLPIFILTLTIANWVKTFPDTEETMAHIGVIALAIVSLGGAMALAGIPYVAGFIALGAAVMILVGVSLMVIGKGIEYMFKSFDPTSALFEKSGEKNLLGMEMTNFEYMMGSIARGFATDPITLSMLYMSIPAFALAGLSLIAIGKSLKEFQDLGVDAVSLAESNIPAVLSALTDAFAQMGQKNRKSGFSFVQGLFVKGDIAEGISAIRGAGEVLSEITTGLIAFADMKFTDINGKEVSLAGGKLQQVTDNIVMVLDTVTEAFAQIGIKNKRDYGFAGRSSMIGSIFTEWFTKGPVAEGISAVSGMGAVLAEITTGLIAFADMKFTGVDGKPIALDGQKLASVTDNIVMVLEVLSESFAYIGDMNKRDYGFNKSGLGALMQGSPLGFMSMAATNLFTKGSVAEGISAVSGMGAVLGEIAGGLVAFADMKFIGVDGKPVMLDGNKLATVTDNIVMVLDVLTDAFVMVGEKNKKDYGFNSDDGLLTKGAKVLFTEMFTRGGVSEGIKAVTGMGTILSEIASGLMTFSELKFTDAEGNVFTMTDEKFALVYTNVGNVLTFLGKIFADIGEQYNAGGFMGFFGANQVTRGIEAIKGVGTEIVNIATATKDFAELIFSDGTNTVQIEPDALKYDPSKPLTDKAAQGKIIYNIASVVSAIAAVFAEIGKNHEEDSFWFPSNYVQLGVEAVKGVGEEMVGIANSTKTMSEILDIDTTKLTALSVGMIKAMVSGMLMAKQLVGEDEDAITDLIPLLKKIPTVLDKSVTSLQTLDTIDEATIQSYQTKVPTILGIIPNAVISAIQTMSESVGDPKEAFDMVKTTTKTIADAIEKIASYEKPLESIATSFKSISTSMTDMGDAINSLDEMKMEKMNTMFSSIKDIAYPEAGLQQQDIPGQIADGIETGITRSLEKTEEVTKKLEQLQEKTLDAQIAASDGGNGVSAEVMKTLFEKLEQQLKLNNLTMQAVITALKTEVLDVNITNQDVFGT